MKTRLKRFTKIALFSILGLAVLQWISFNLFAKKAMISQLGEHYESAVLEYNDFEAVNFISPIELDSNDVVKNFNLLDGYKMKIFIDTTFNSFNVDSMDYNYGFDFAGLSTFGKSTVYEIEHARQFMADWDSTYVWVLFGWVFIEKNMKSIT
jgi:hypothetical protein